MRLLRLDEYSRAQHFLDTYWAKGHIYTRSKALFDWSFQRASFSQDHYCFAVSEVDGEVTGILGAMPMVMNDHGTLSQGAYLANWMVRPEFRRGGVGLSLLDFFKELGFTTLFAFGIAKEARRLYQAMRWGYMTGTPRRFLIFSTGAEEFFKVMRVAHPEWEEARIRGLYDAFSTSMTLEGARENGAPDWEEWDRFLTREHAPRTAGVLRDSKFLTWRYLEHPIFKYNVRITSGEPGLLVWRLETIQRATAEGREPIAKMARLVEFLPSSPKNAEDLFGTFVAEAKKAGAFGVDYYGYHGPTGLELERLGLDLADKHPDGDSIPSRFQPLDGRGGNLVSSVLHKGSAPPCYPFGRECPWYWTKGDSDQDRPN